MHHKKNFKCPRSLKVRLAIALQSQITSFRIYIYTYIHFIYIYIYIYKYQDIYICNLISHSIEFERSGYYKGELIFCCNEMRK